MQPTSATPCMLFQSALAVSTCLPSSLLEERQDQLISYVERCIEVINLYTVILVPFIFPLAMWDGLCGGLQE